MKTLQIKGSLRESTGKKQTKKLRQSGLIPCVMYGGDEIIHFYIHDNIFRSLIYTANTYLLKLDIDGKQYDAVLKEIQFHPVSDKVIHADFVRVIEDRKVTIKLPIRLVGSSIGLRNGGKLRQRRRYLKVRGQVKDMPDFCDIDITDVDIGKFVKIGDLKFENLDILDPYRAMVVGVVSSRLIAKGLREPVAEVPEAEKAEKAEAEKAEAEKTEAEKAEAKKGEGKKAETKEHRKPSEEDSDK